MNLTVAKLNQNDFSDYYRLVGDEKVMAMITERAIPLQEAQTEFEKKLKKNEIHPDFGIFKILGKENGEFVGLAKLEIQASDSTEAELGYMLLPEYWGKGIAGKIAKELIAFAGQQKQLTRLFAIIDPKNLPSRKILTNNGFVHQEYKGIDGFDREILALKL